MINKKNWCDAYETTCDRKRQSHIMPIVKRTRRKREVSVRFFFGVQVKTTGWVVSMEPYGTFVLHREVQLTKKGKVRTKRGWSLTEPVTGFSVNKGFTIAETLERAAIKMSELGLEEYKKGVREVKEGLGLDTTRNMEFQKGGNTAKKQKVICETVRKMEF